MGDFYTAFNHTLNINMKETYICVCVYCVYELLFTVLIYNDIDIHSTESAGTIPLSFLTYSIMFKCSTGTSPWIIFTNILVFLVRKGRSLRISWIHIPFDVFIIVLHIWDIIFLERWLKTCYVLRISCITIGHHMERILRCKWFALWGEILITW